MWPVLRGAPTMSQNLFGVTPRDGTTFIAVSLLVIVVGLGANVFPRFPIQLGYLDQVPAEPAEAGRFPYRDSYFPHVLDLPLPLVLPSVSFFVPPGIVPPPFVPPSVLTK